MLNAIDVSVSLPDRSRKPVFGSTPLIPILHGVNLDVEKGEAIGVVGESGSGKTTLGRTLLRLYRPNAGRVVFEGRDLGELSDREMISVRLRMQMIFQDSQSALNPRQRIIKILAAPFIAHGLLDRKAAAIRAVSLLERVGLSEAHGDRYPHELSGGQRQRVGIARAIALAPSVVVADEIVSGLDVSMQAHILYLLRDLLAERGMGIVFVSHDLSVVRTLCSRVAVLQQGEVVEAGDCSEIFARPRHAYTQALLRAIPLPVVDRTWFSDGREHPPTETAAA